MAKPKAVELGPFTALIYGIFGSGKTWAAGTAQRHQDLKDVLFLDYDLGLSTLDDRARTNALSVTPQSYVDLHATIKDVVARKGPYASIKTVVIDSLTDMSNYFTDFASIGGYEAPKTKGDKVRDDQFSRQQQDYGKSISAIRWTLYTLKQAGFNLILLCPMRELVEDEKIIAYAPDLSDRLRQTVLFGVSNVWHIAKQSNGSRKLLVSELKSSLHFIKTRNPDYLSRLIQYTKDSATERGKDPDAASGWVVIPDTNFPLLPALYNIRQGMPIDAGIIS